MRVICAWCGRIMKEGPLEPVSHGICWICKKRILAELPEEKEEVPMDTARKIEALEMIAKDMKNDATNFDGRLFNGKTVAEYFGNQGAAITALANILKSIFEEEGKIKG